MKKTFLLSSILFIFFGLFSQVKPLTIDNQSSKTAKVKITYGDERILWGCGKTVYGENYNYTTIEPGCSESFNYRDVKSVEIKWGYKIRLEQFYLNDSTITITD